MKHDPYVGFGGAPSVAGDCEGEGQGEPSHSPAVEPAEGGHPNQKYGSCLILVLDGF